ncbi:MAG: PEP-CTERM sorting domain-containing protein [Verrucomicrobiota bacterium]|nr:PEP-CTERM sorting domain-containing protein [Verrucomicrobiota bacterium]
MRSLSVFSSLSILACGLVCGPQAGAQGTIVHTVLSNTHGGLFGPEGVPVYSAGVGGPWSTLSVDLNHDGIEDFRVVATGDTDGWRLEGLANNASWARPAGGTDVNSWLIPLGEGAKIGSLVPVPGSWIISQQTPYGTIAPVISAYSWSGGAGLFVNTTAYAGVQFSIGSETHYGWVKLQEIPGLAGGGIVYEYAYETRPGVPILAGAVPEPSAWALLVGGGVLLVWFRRKRNARRG